MAVSDISKEQSYYDDYWDNCVLYACHIFAERLGKHRKIYNTSDFQRADDGWICFYRTCNNFGKGSGSFICTFYYADQLSFLFDFPNFNAFVNQYDLCFGNGFDGKRNCL
jgi:hypothetical protein